MWLEWVSNEPVTKLRGRRGEITKPRRSQNETATKPRGRRGENETADFFLQI